MAAEESLAAALESLRLGQLDNVETCTSAIDGDFQDLLDTTDLPSKEAWKALSEALERWRSSTKAAQFWGLVSEYHHQQQRDSGGSVEVPGHRALLALLHLALKSKGGVDLWVLATMYVWMMDFPGASAYGVFNANMFRCVLALLKSWVDGGKANESSSQSQTQSQAKRGKRGAASETLRDDSEDDAEDDNEGDNSDGGSVRRRKPSARSGSRKKTATAPDTKGIELLLNALEDSLTRGSLQSSLQAHDDMQGELAELVLAIYAKAPAKGGLREAAHGAVMILLMMGPHAVAGNPLVLRALMPMLTMKPGRSGIPTDARSRTAAHQKALQVLLAMVAEGEEQKSRLREDTNDGNEHEKVRDGSADDEKGEDEEGEASDDDVQEGDDDMEEKEDDTAMNVDEHEEAAEGSVPDEDGEGEDEAEDDSEDDDDADDVADGAAQKRAAKKSKSKQGCKKSKTRKTKDSAADAPKPSLHVTTLSVLQHMCSDAPDRADVRGRVVDSVLTVLEALKKAAPELDSRFVTFLSKLMRSSKVSNRASGVELAASFLMMPWAWPTTDDHDKAPPQGSEANGSSEVGPSSIMSMVALMGSFASRVLDKAPTVRSRAMVCLSEMLNSVHEGAAPPRLKEALLALAFPSTSVPEGQDLVSLVRSRVQDDKAVVRKAALQALEILLTTRTSGESLTKEDVSLFSTRCNDMSVLTRKQAIGSLSSLLLSDPANKSLQETWVRAVLPLVADPEQSILNRLAELFNEVVMDRVLAWHKDVCGHASSSSSTSRARRGAPALSSQQPEETDRSVWQLLSIVASRDLNKCLGQAVTMVMHGAAQDKAHTAARRVKDLMEALRAAALASLDSSTDAAEAIFLRRGAWALLEALLVKDSVSPGGSISGAAGAATASAACRGGGGVMVPSDPGFVVACWRQALQGLGELMEQAAAGEEGSAEAQALACALEDDARKILRVLSRIAQDVPGEMAMELADELLGALAELDPRLSPENCGAALETIAALCLTKAESPEQGVEILQNAADEILRSVEVVLKAFVVDREQVNDPELIPRLERATFLVGAVAILGFTANEEEIKPSSAAAEKRKAAKKAAAASGAALTIRIPVPAPTVSLLSVLLAPKLLPVTHQDESGQQQTKEAVTVPEQVRAHAFLALGKACLRSKALAKDNMNLFVRELSVGSSPAIKSNALLILGDLCVRYTYLVERHVPAMARCLQDENALIRRHALSLMSQLLLQDYLKWRGLLLYRYLAMLVDVNHRVSDVANYMIFGPLLRKSPSLLVTHFVEAMVVLNGCEDHENYKAALSQGAETGSAVTMEGVDLEGDGVKAKRRMHVYKTMLQHMTDEQRIQVAAKLTQSILDAVTDDDGESGGIKIMSHHRAARHGQQKREALLRKLKRNENLIRDAVAILRCSDIKVSGGGKSGGAAADEDAESLMANDEGTSGADAAAAAKKKLLSKVSRKHLLEHVVPTVVSLKGCLERAHSPLLRDVMEYLADMMRANKDEVKDALSADPTLFHELEYDLAQYEKEIRANAEPRHVMMPVASTDAATAAQSMAPPPPRSPAAGLLNSRRRSSMASAAMQTAARRRSSIGLHRATATPSMTGCSAPRLRRSSIGAPLSRTPAEAMKSALTGGGLAEIKSPQVLTATPMNVDRDNDGVRRETVNVKMPDAMKQWQVDVAGSPLDEPPRSKENKPQQQTACA